MNIKILGTLAAVALLAACSNQTTTSTPPVSSGDRVFYDLNRSTLRSDARTTLERQAAWLAKWSANNVQVAGNCDERGTQAYNIALGNRRASAARDFLVAKGVAAGRITTISFGKDRPTALGSNEQAWSQNRNAITSVR